MTSYCSVVRVRLWVVLALDSYYGETLAEMVQQCCAPVAEDRISIHEVLRTLVRERKRLQVRDAPHAFVDTSTLFHFLTLTKYLSYYPSTYFSLALIVPTAARQRYIPSSGLRAKTWPRV